MIDPTGPRRLDADADVHSGGAPGGASGGRGPASIAEASDGTRAPTTAAPERTSAHDGAPRRAAAPPLAGLRAVFRRELASYFATPLAAVFLVIFLFLAGIFTFTLGGLYDRGQADLRPFFWSVPWLLLVLAPALSMRLWAEERRQGTLELLMTLPLRLSDLVLGKFLAAWCFAILAILLTAPIWATVEFLGTPDRGAIIAGYVGTGLLAGAFLAVGAAISALTRSQVIAFVLCAVTCFAFVIAGFPAAIEVLRAGVPGLPGGVVDAIASLSFLARFESIVRGVIDLRDVLYFVSVIAAFLVINAVVVEWRKGS
ncbi:MAG TPA: ABC transporter permease subunit [Phycisphaerales bacterium]|nr:ABC transporter permease subunit [Phycisphaerales bacterium]HMP38666.1 ABC transporter permease subunit [Phycisphaerales bacterium]